jgi:hypothetical protein
MIENTDICHGCKHSTFVLDQVDLDYDTYYCDRCCHGKEDLFEEKEENLEKYD